MWTARSLQLRLNTELALGVLPVPAWVAAAAFVSARFVSPALAWAASSMAVAGGLAWVVVHVRRHGYSEDQAAVVLDRAAKAGGLLLTVRERPSREWETALWEKVRDVRPPPLRIGRPAAMTAGALVFALIAAWVPMPEKPATSVDLAARSQVASAVGKAQTLASEMPLPEAISAELARLGEELRANSFDATDWEATDNVDDAIEDEARARGAALEKAAQAAERLAKTLGEGVEDEAVEREKEELEEALAELGEEARKKGGSESSTDSREAGGDADQSKAAEDRGGTNQAPSVKQGRGPRTRAEAQAMRDALDRRREELANRFADKGQGRGQAAGQRPGTGRGRGDNKGRPGFGPSHGPAEDTPLRFGDETKFQKDRLAFAPLPEGRGGDDSGTLWGMNRRAPTRGPGSPAAAPTGLASGLDQTPGANEGTVPPRHRELVRRYFDRPAATAPKQR